MWGLNLYDGENYLFLFPAILSMTTAMAPSPVTLHAVPKLSRAMYMAIMIACMVSSNPSIPSMMPNAAITVLPVRQELRPS